MLSSKSKSVRQCLNRGRVNHVRCEFTEGERPELLGGAVAVIRVGVSCDITGMWKGLPRWRDDKGLCSSVSSEM